MFKMLNKKSIFSFLALSSMCSFGFAQHTIEADFGTRVSGPNSAFTMNLMLNPADTDISGFAIVVCYDSTQVTLTGVSDNTGQPFAAADYEIGPASPISGKANVNTQQTVIMSTLNNLITPSMLGQLEFTSTAAYSDPNNRVWVYLQNSQDELGGLTDGNLEVIPTDYLDEGDDSQLVPVSLSQFSIE